MRSGQNPGRGNGKGSLWPLKLHEPTALHRYSIESRVDLLSEQEVTWWEPPDQDDEDECAGFTAFALATLRWIHRELAGRVPVPSYTRDEAIAWLSSKRGASVQLSLWDWDGADAGAPPYEAIEGEQRLGLHALKCGLHCSEAQLVFAVVSPDAAEMVRLV